jgi:hypothetical protein
MSRSRHHYLVGEPALQRGEPAPSRVVPLEYRVRDIGAMTGGLERIEWKRHAVTRFGERDAAITKVPPRRGQ